MQINFYRKTALGLASAAVLAGATCWPAAAAPVGDTAINKSATADGRPYSLPAAAQLPPRVLWGNTHIHTSNSFDAGMFGALLGPEDAFRFARGEEVISSSGIPAKLSRPLDFLVVTDHSDYMGLPDALRTGAPELVQDKVGKQWYDIFKSAGPRELVMMFMQHMGTNSPTLESTALLKSAWTRSVAAAEKYNDPGRFTALIGFEWSSSPGGNNLHRNVIFRDDGDRARQVLPLSSNEYPDPEQLWKYLSNYEKQTGGQVLAIPHNSNLSGGLMFSDKTFAGEPFDRAYAEQRAKWEPLVEVTQGKGDSETDPSVSPDDEFANFERWNRTNLMMNRANAPAEQSYNYLRPTLTRGLKLQQSLGVNPYKFGMVSGTDAHTGLTTVDPDNYFGQLAENEPNRERAAAPPQTVLKGSKFDIAYADEAPGGLTGVWARTNTRADIFDAMRRKEVYGTTGPRITLRVFAGWNFQAQDVHRSDFAAYGYANGVPMGGDLTEAASGQAPTLLIQTAKDPEGANLDRVQVVKGWIDSSGKTHEKIFDVAWSGNRRPDRNGRLPPVGNTVDVANATYTNAIGAPTLNTHWTDTQFNRTERAYYYLRVIEIPTPRWTTYDAKRFGAELSTRVPATVTQRAYTSPIWYEPAAAR